MYQQLSEKENYLGKQVVDIAVKIHRELGPGLLESIYEKCFCYELFRHEIPFERQKSIPIVFGRLHIDDGLRLNILIDGLIIVELKAQEVI